MLKRINEVELTWRRIYKENLRKAEEEFQRNLRAILEQEGEDTLDYEEEP